MQDAPACKACSSPVTGKEFPYIAAQPATADIPGLIKWWGIWCLAIWALSGFSLGVTTSLLFSGVSLIYLVRILRAYYR
jgi:hypothetical protein